MPLKSIADVARGNQINLFCEYMRSRSTQTTASLQVLPLFSLHYSTLFTTPRVDIIWAACDCVSTAWESLQTTRKANVMFTIYSVRCKLLLRLVHFKTYSIKAPKNKLATLIFRQSKEIHWCSKTRLHNCAQLTFISLLLTLRKGIKLARYWRAAMRNNWMKFRC